MVPRNDNPQKQINRGFFFVTQASHYGWDRYRGPAGQSSSLHGKFEVGRPAAGQERHCRGHRTPQYQARIFLEQLHSR